MNFQQTMSALEEAGTAQNRKVYARHGVKGEIFGVSYADQGKLAQKIKRDHALALELWATGNHDARILAATIADPGRMGRRDLDAWARDLDSYVVTGAFAGLAARSAHARSKSEKWRKAKGEWVGTAGWSLVGSLARADGELTDDDFLALLGEIEAGIHGAKNRVRYAMNQALICIGVRNPRLRRAAVAAAKRIGKVEVDHGETGCKTPEAVSYIAKTVEYQRQKKTKAAARLKAQRTAKKSA